MSLHLRYRFSKAQHQGNSKASLTDAEIVIKVGPEGATAQLSAPKHKIPADLVEASKSTLASVMAALPSGFEKYLTVETGMITETLFSAGKAIIRKKRVYTLVSCRGVIIILNASLGARASSHWKNETPEDYTAKRLPLVLGPS